MQIYAKQESMSTDYRMQFVLSEIFFMNLVDGSCILVIFVGQNDKTYE